MFQFRSVLLFAALFVCTSAGAQIQVFNHDDTLRGSITPERAWWDLCYYRLDVQVFPDKKGISGSNEIFYRVLEPGKRLQVDLQPPLRITRVEQDGDTLPFEKIGRNAYLVSLQKPQRSGMRASVTVWYEGMPREARHAPWDGGFSWSDDGSGKPFIATSCQGLGASVWWPCKDHMYDEPDSQTVIVTVPKGLMDVSNGRLRRTTENPDGTRSFEWFVSNPINNYGINLNIGDYTHFSDTFLGEKGILDLDYYVLPKNLEKAKVQFAQVKKMLKAFEYWFGPYPFYEDGYKLVEVPYLGMEHQSSITYGNGYRNGYRGTDLSDTGWGLKWDFIIVHESGHEWFANNITYRDIADMWVHESFTNYSEGLYTEYYYGKEAGAAYIRGCRKLIENRSPITGIYGVNSEGSIDMYYKGGNMLHTIRQIVDDDVKWRDILRGLNREFYHQTVDGAQIEAYMIRESGKPLQKVFDQYLLSTDIPVLEYRISKNKLEYRWTNCVDGFDMPVKVVLHKGKYEFIYPTTEWKSSACKLSKRKDLKIDENFYVNSRKM
ncbi:MAG: M1 family metallopeptidase [Saprospiraceae bacterium]|nr:M1 family metallopeptidase [Saprospiraceae bacterium]